MKNPFFGWIIKRRARRLAKMREKAAMAFNDIYSYGLSLDGAHRWMCPTCNRVHEECGVTWTTGIQYPACCEYPDGPRWGDGMNTDSLLHLERASKEAKDG